MSKVPYLLLLGAVGVGGGDEWRGGVEGGGWEVDGPGATATSSSSEYSS